jgi:hypothetical protein
MSGIDCTRPKQAPTMNTSAVIALVTVPPPHVSLTMGTTKATAPSSV